MARFQALLLPALLLFSCAKCVQATQDLELSNILLPSSAENSEIFSRAIDFLDSLKSESACHQFASKELVDSCQSISDDANPTTSNDIEQVLEISRNEYAARLAVCELNTAKAMIPKVCSRFVPSSEACTSGSWWRTKSSEQQRRVLCYPQSSKQQVQKCISGLEEKPQSWTSFSNARQNAVMLCQASRERIELGMHLVFASILSRRSL